MEMFDQPGGCVPPVAMVPVDGGVGGVLTRIRITKPASIDGERTQRSNSARSRGDIHARRRRHRPWSHDAKEDVKEYA
jgi:hypothetical protein